MDGATLASLTLSQYNFPRTGKRGVPQQFPRRLYEMLEAEAFQLDASAEHPRIISWSDSGKAFRIYDISEFSATILPKYFRTKKFSSFQRNLNLVSTCIERGGNGCRGNITSILV
jgi:HSF-type DNA-binding